MVILLDIRKIQTIAVKIHGSVIQNTALRLQTTFETCVHLLPSTVYTIVFFRDD